MKMKSTTLQQISLGRATYLSRQKLREHAQIENKAVLTAGASKQISAYVTSYFEARTTNRIKKELLLCCYFGKGTLVCLKVSLIK